MKKSDKLSIDDLQIFYDAVKGTTLLARKNTKSRITRAQREPTTPPSKETYKEHFNFLNQDSETPVTSDSQLEYKHSSISNKVLRKLHKGQYNVSAVLDLHGKTVEKARIALDAFLFNCLHQNVRVVLIIHGKGNPSKMPKLKNQLNQWLRQTSLVLAFCSASMKDGGSGAVYVLLKNSRS